MNIIELVKYIVQSFPEISEVCSEIHVDFTDDTPTNYGISSTGDKLLTQYVNGDEKRSHHFILYAVYQSMNDYDRITNSGLLLKLQMYLENYSGSREITAGMPPRAITLRDPLAGESLSTCDELLPFRCRSASGVNYAFVPYGTLYLR